MHAAVAGETSDSYTTGPRPIVPDEKHNTITPLGFDIKLKIIVQHRHDQKTFGFIDAINLRILTYHSSLY